MGSRCRETRKCAVATDVGLRTPAAGLPMTTWSRMTTEAARPSSDCRRIVIRLRYRAESRGDRQARRWAVVERPGVAQVSAVEHDHRTSGRHDLHLIRVRAHARAKRQHVDRRPGHPRWEPGMTRNGPLSGSEGLDGPPITTDQKAGGSSPSESLRAPRSAALLLTDLLRPASPPVGIERARMSAAAAT